MLQVCRIPNGGLLPAKMASRKRNQINNLTMSTVGKFIATVRVLQIGAV
jgi:hypothetical protein